MNLGAYKNIEDLSEIAKKNNIEVPYEESDNLDYFETFFEESFLVKKETIIK